MNTVRWTVQLSNYPFAPVNNLFPQNFVQRQEHAPPLATAHVETGKKFHITGDVTDRAASGGCCVSSCCALRFLCEQASNRASSSRGRRPVSQPSTTHYPPANPSPNEDLLKGQTLSKTHRGTRLVPENEPYPQSVIHTPPQLHNLADIGGDCWSWLLPPSLDRQAAIRRLPRSR